MKYEIKWNWNPRELKQTTKQQISLEIRAQTPECPRVGFYIIIIIYLL